MSSFQDISNVVAAAPEETIDVLYNICYGGFNLSKEAIKLYNERSPDVKIYEPDTSSDEDDEPDSISKESKSDKSSPRNTIHCCWIDRHDPVLISVYKDLGKKCSGECSKLAIRTIPKIYENYYDIAEYDGKENVVINIHKYLAGETRSIVMNPDKSNDEKIDDIKKLLEKH
jgi:hypothetical protein